MEKNRYQRHVDFSERQRVLKGYRVTRSLLSVFAAMYGGAQKLHLDIYRYGWRLRHRLPCAVISIGNLVAGGTGKTPMTHYVAALSRQLGYQAIVISRGYRGRAERWGGVVSDGVTLRMSPRDAGDEPFMLASALTDVPLVVGQDRFRSGLLGIDRFHPDLIILDDGFQHLRLKRDLDILLLDGRRPFGNGHLIPRGTLREPPGAIRRADAVVLTRTGPADTLPGGVNRYLGGRPLFRSSHQPVIEKIVAAGEIFSPLFSKEPGDWTGLKRKRIFAFSGIARNKDFCRSIYQLGGEIVESKSFPDHYHYDHQDLADINRAAAAAGVDCLVTTAKDYVRLGPEVSFSLDLVVVNVAIRFDDDRFDTFFTDKLTTII